MGVPVILFKLEKYQLYSGKKYKKFTEEEDWTQVECLYHSMISPSRDLISNTYYQDLGEKFIWGSIDPFYDEPYLSYISKLNVTKMSFSTLKKIWEKALNEKLELEKNDEVTNETIVCLAQGN